MSDSDKTEHPAPWRWDFVQLDGTATLVDASGESILIDESGHDGMKLPAPLARELIRLAPEMADALRKVMGLIGDIRPAHPVVAEVTNILSWLDAARKG